MRLFSDVSQFVRDPWLRYALNLAERGRGTTSPNPLVGCVIVAEDAAVGVGYHERAGAPHAEIVALGDAGERARGATAYVTLEPCAHQGLTPPCTDALIAAGLTRIVIGMRDPNPHVAGDGASRLREAGIEVVFAEDAWPFAVQNEAWLKSVTVRSPFARAKVAVSLDGRPALESGRPAAITGASGAEVVAHLRSRADAVLVGAATVDADDPALTVREPGGALVPRQPRRVVLARTRLPSLDRRIFTDGAAETLVLVPESLEDDIDPLLGRGVAVHQYSDAASLAGAFHVLGTLGVVDLLVEPGPRLLSSLWTEGALDELIVVAAGGMAAETAPALFLGNADRSGDRLEHRMTALEAGVVGDVAVNVWRPSVPAETPASTTAHNA